MDYEHIIYEKADGVATITLNRPERLNALNVRIGVEVLQALDDAEFDESIRVVVLTGAGRAFCAGDDIKRVPEEDINPPRYPDPAKQYVYGVGRWVTIVRTMMRLPKPVVGVVNGHAHGAGFNLALGCDFRILSEEATLCTPFVKRGLSTGSNRLQQFVGIGKALEWTMLGTVISAREADRWGLATIVVPADELECATSKFVDSLKKAPTAILGYTKSAVMHGWEQTPDVAYEFQGTALGYSQRTEDYEEGRLAFREKRQPAFNGLGFKEETGVQ